MVTLLRRMWLRRFSRLNEPWNSSIEDPRQLGEAGEKLAADFLLLKRCHVLKRDFHPKHGGQVDLVVRDGDVLVFVEVKTRSSRDYYRAFYAVDEGQKRRIHKSAQFWLRELAPLQPTVRFDIIEVYVEKGRRPQSYWFIDAF